MPLPMQMNGVRSHSPYHGHGRDTSGAEVGPGILGANANAPPDVAPWTPTSAANGNGPINAAGIGAGVRS